MTDPSPSGQSSLLVLDDRFRVTFLAEFDFVCRSLRRFGVRDADVHDIAQELFVALHRSLDKFEPDRSTRAWLMGFVVRFASNYRRLGWHRGSGIPDDAAVPSPRMTEKLAARQLVERGLDALDFDKQVALVMHDLEGISAPEIAQQLNVPLNTVYSRVRLARAGFKAAILRLDGSTEEEMRAR